MAIFKEISQDLAHELVTFAKRRGVKAGDSIVIEGKKYIFNYRSQNKDSFFHSRSISLYFRVGRSVVRIADHWSKSKLFDRSRKMNCGRLGGGICGVDEKGYALYSKGVFWELANKTRKQVYFMFFNRFESPLIGGICGLKVLNKECNHWKKNQLTK